MSLRAQALPRTKIDVCYDKITVRIDFLFEIRIRTIDYGYQL